LQCSRREAGQSTVFFASFVVILAILTAVVLEVCRLAYARGEVAKAADAAALAAASRAELSTYRNSGQVTFLPDVLDYAQEYASLNSGYLSSRSIPVAVGDVRPDPTTRVVAVSVTTDLLLLVPSLLQGGGVVTVAGYAQVRLEGK
jgi:uncharacterized membrane protein